MHLLFPAPEVQESFNQGKAFAGTDMPPRPRMVLPREPLDINTEAGL
jgi:hypothetical protein